MILDRAVRRDADEGLGCELQHIGHDADVRLQGSHCGRGFGNLQTGKSVDQNTALGGGEPEDARTRALFFRRGKYPDDLIAAVKKGFKDGLAEILLSDQRYPHDTLGPLKSWRVST